MAGLVSSERPWAISLAIVISAQVLAVVTLSFNLAFLPFYLAQDLHVGDAQAVQFWTGVTTACTPAMIMVFGPIWGALADRLGQKPMMLRSLFGVGIVFLLQAVAQDTTQFLLLRLAIGLFAGVNQATIAMVTMVVPRERLGTGLGWVQTGRFVGLTAGPALGGFSADLLGYRGAYVLAGVVGLALFAVAALMLPNPPAAARSGPARSVLSGFRYVGANRGLLPLMFLLFALQVGLSGVLAFVPVLVEQLAGGSARVASLAGLILSASGVSAAASGVFAGSVASRFGYRPVLILGALVSTVLQLLHVLVQTPEHLLLVRFLLGLTFGGLQPLVQAILGLSVPRERSGMIFGVSGSVQSAANLIGPTTGSLLAVSIGLSGPFYMAAAMMAASALVAWTSVREPLRQPSPPIVASG
jgi:DHA1 family multidrug resistance protein-like MFS transporter